MFQKTISNYFQDETEHELLQQNPIKKEKVQFPQGIGIALTY